MYSINYKSKYTSFPGGLDGKESSCNVGDLGSIHGLGGSPGEGNGYSLQYSSWKILWTGEPGGLQFIGLKESDMTERLILSYLSRGSF